MRYYISIFAWRAATSRQRRKIHHPKPSSQAVRQAKRACFLLDDASGRLPWRMKPEGRGNAFKQLRQELRAKLVSFFGR
jgi:hypothetical protein